MPVNYPMVDLLTGTIMPLMYLNTLVVCCLLPLTSPWLFMQAWTKGLQDARASAGIRRAPITIIYSRPHCLGSTCHENGMDARRR